MEGSLQKRGLSALLILTLLVAVGTVFQNFRFDRSFTQERAARLATERGLGSMEVALANLRAAETGYLAAGQGPDVWMRRASDRFEEIETSITSLRADTQDVVARTHYDGAETALNSLAAIDKRARDSVRDDQRFVASDLVFVDGLDASKRLSDEISAARTAESAAADARLLKVTRIRAIMNALALGLALVCGAIATRSAMKSPRSAAASEAERTAQMLRDLPPPVRNGAVPAARVAPAPAPTPAPVGQTATAVASPAAAVPVLLASAVNLPAAADLCLDFARVMDERDMPLLLERTAKVLEAKGVIVWTADRAGRTLRPLLTHGYPDRVLARLGTLDVDSDNVTSLSFRSMRPQTLNGGNGNAGAVAIPLINSAGCAGVLAAEVRDSRPASEVIAIARIIGAQISSLIAAPEETAEARAAQA